MISQSKDKIFALSNRYFSYVLRVTEEGLLEHLYYGGAVKQPLSLTPHNPRIERGGAVEFEGKPNLNLNSMAQEYPTFGTSDYRFPALHGLNPHGNTVFSLRYKKHETVTNKPRLKNLPSARGGDSETLIITLEDPLHKLEATLYYTVYADYGVLARSVKVKNNGAKPIDLQHVFSSSLDLPPDDYDILHLHGTWAREFNEERLTLPKGRFVIDSARGTSSAAHNPFIALMEKDATENYGRVYASALM